MMAVTILIMMIAMIILNGNTNLIKFGLIENMLLRKNNM